MNTKLTKFKHAALFLVGISAASIPAMARADWWMTGLGGIGGSDSLAAGINDSGQVVGVSSSGSGQYHAFITGPNGTGMTSLGEFTSKAFAINDSGEVVGRDIFGHAFLYSHGVMTDLSLLDPFVTGGWSDIYVLDINNHGQMVGYGHHNNFPEAFLLSYTPPPIPEPETYLMLLAGLGLVGLMARRRKAANM